MSYNRVIEEHFSKLEDQAGRDLYDPSKLTVTQNKEFLDNLIIKAKEKTKSKEYDEAYVCFRRFQILINIIQQRGLFDNNNEEIIYYSSVWICVYSMIRNVDKSPQLLVNCKIK